jgi:hypothetical protein
MESGLIAGASGFLRVAQRGQTLQAVNNHIRDKQFMRQARLLRYLGVGDSQGVEESGVVMH